MSEYWKSTPTHWCKFCSTYIRDTPLERKNHEASGKHQNNIQRSLRTLHQGKEREEREKQRARDEVARLNGIVSGGGVKQAIDGGRRRTGAVPHLDAAAQRKVHAEQLAALGVQLPEALKREVTGVGGWETVSERVVEGDRGAGGRSLADIIKQEGEGENKEDVKGKRKADGEDDEAEVAPKRLAWGSRLKQYPGVIQDGGGGEDLDALLSRIAKKKPSEEEVVKQEVDVVKEEETEESALSAIPDIETPAVPVKQEEHLDEAIAPVVFKKRKVKR